MARVQARRLASAIFSDTFSIFGVTPRLARKHPAQALTSKEIKSKA